MTTQTREQKLEMAVRAAMQLRKKIEPIPEKNEIQVAQLLVPIEAVKNFDAIMESLK